MMRSDRYKSAVLTVIAVCLAMLVLTEVSVPESLLPSEATAVGLGGSVSQKPRSAGQTRALPPDPSLPLRRKVPWATQTSGGTTFCGTAIIVTNETASTVSTEVQWVFFNSTPVDQASTTIDPEAQKIFVTGSSASQPDIDYSPFSPDDWAELGIYLGYARIYADDPRIHVAAFQYCRDGVGSGKNIVSITNIPTDPVGATMEYFTAGMPAAEPGRVAKPVMPE
jgi:hypothetical protein